MRFNVASALLLQALPSTSSIFHEDDGKVASAATTVARKELMKGTYSNPKNAGMQERKMMMTSRLMRKKTRQINTGGTKILQNIDDNKLHNHEETTISIGHQKASSSSKPTGNVVECDPKTPDQGILACGMRRYKDCVVSQFVCCL